MWKNQNNTFKLSKEEIIDKIKHTPFDWNSNIDWKLLLQHITYKFSININIVGFKLSKYHFQCKRHTNLCYFPYYIFQNTFIKFFNISNQFETINLLFFNKKYYILHKTLTPCLINYPIINNIQNKNIFITYHDIDNILNKKKVNLTFNIFLYTSYNFLSKKSINQLQNNLIGKHFFSEKAESFNLFLTPYMEQNKFYISVLSDIALPNNQFNLKPNFHSLRSLNEFKRISNKQNQEQNLEKTLNQEFCICDHDTTQRIFLPPNNSYKCLTSTESQKFFLYEHLQAFNLLNNRLNTILKICSELSFLSFDVESLNKSFYNDVINELSNNFVPCFGNETSPKINYGIQQLYTIGLVDILPINLVLKIFEKYFPSSLFLKLKKYTTTNFKFLKSNISWNVFKSKLEDLNMEKCATELISLFETYTFNEKNVQIFHIGKNNESKKSVEPSIQKICQMVYHFITYIYQRNVVASLVKFILLKPLIKKFETSNLTLDNKGIFVAMKERLQEIIFETILTAFNGANYDNYLICNALILIQSKINVKLNIFKKGSSLSTILLKFKRNLKSITNILNYTNKNKKNKNFKNFKYSIWPLNLFIKDIRNLVASNLSLDKLGKLFNLNVSKLCFPYNQATSIKKLKKLNSLLPYDNDFWYDSFTNKTILLEDRINAQKIYENNNFANVYEYSIFYLKKDCVLLHSIVLTLFNTYLLNNINIYIRRNYSQSSLSFQQFFIIDPSKQIEIINAPKKINNIFFNYFIKQAVTGGLCTSFVQGLISKDTIINEHFNYLDYPNLNKHNWPNFFNCYPWNKNFNIKPTGINTIDIRSLYPSAALKKIPVGSPLFYSRFISEDYHKLHNKKFITYDLQGFCNNVQSQGNTSTDFFKLLNSHPRFHNEFYAIKFYLNSLPKDLIIVRFQSNFTALGQLYFGNFPVDAFLTYKKPNMSQTFIKIIQYNSVYYHGHKNSCGIKNDNDNAIKFKKTNLIKNKIVCLYLHFKNHFNLSDIEFEYVEISDCDFFLHKIPKDNSFLFSYKNNYSYQNFLDNIYKKTLTGFLVIKNLEVKKENQNPIMGFIIQKVEYNTQKLSPFTINQLKSFNSSKRVIAMNNSKSFMVISTEYFNWLKETFGFEKTPDIYHALLFKTDYYLKASIENKLCLRKELKLLISKEKNTEKRQNLEIQSELIKLMLNSCYGFTLCNLTSTKFKQYEIRQSCPKILALQKHIKSCLQLNDHIFLIEKKKKNVFPFETLLGHVGCSILFHSKIIFLKRLYFLLKYLNPTNAQLLYMDTDSAHFLVKHKNFRNNVDSNLISSFDRQYSKHFESGNKISGIWVEEGFFDIGEYIGEKCYKLYNENEDKFITHMKGLNSYFQNTVVKSNINISKNPIISYNQFFKSPDFIIYKSYMSKNLFLNYIPVKRYFISATGSLPLKF
jgi:hypothetical protein